MDSGKKDRKISTSNVADYNARHSKEIEDCRNTFIDHLKTAREAKGYTQEKAAKELDIQLVTYRKIEQGTNRKDTAFFLNSLATAFGVSADYLVGLSDKPHPEYDEVIASTGLNERALKKLQELHRLDGAEGEYAGYMDFVNCFLGNESCTEMFFQALMPILRSLYNAMYGEYPSNSMANTMTAELIDHVTDYIKKVVVPTYGQLYHNGNYDSADVLQYLTDDAVHQKK